jgi:hypothetical protein
VAHFYPRVQAPSAPASERRVFRELNVRSGDAEMSAVAMNGSRRSTDQRLADMKMPVAPVLRCIRHPNPH